MQAFLGCVQLFLGMLNIFWRGAFRWTANISPLFFPLPPPILLFLLFLGVFSWNCDRDSWNCDRDSRPRSTQSARVGSLRSLCETSAACRPPGLTHNDPRGSQTCTLGGPRPVNRATIPRDDPQRGKKERNWRRKREKRENLAPPPPFSLPPHTHTTTTTLRLQPPFGPPP